MPSMKDYPALTGDVVTERHARICRERGHATHTVDGEISPYCPRCGEYRHSTVGSLAVDIFEASISAGDCSPQDVRRTAQRFEGEIGETTFTRDVLDRAVIEAVNYVRVVNRTINRPWRDQ